MEELYSMVQQRTEITKPVMRRQELLAKISLSLIVFVKMFQIISYITLTKLMKVKFVKLNTGDGGENVVTVHKILGYTLYCTLTLIINLSKNVCD